MNILAIESSTVSCSVALCVDGRIVAAREMRSKDVAARVAANLHSQVLPISAGAEAKNSDVLLGEIRRVLADAGLAIAQLDAIAFGAGPGAFTGVRVACGVAQGLALGVDIPVLPINNLLAMAAQHALEPHSPSTAVLSVFDARMGEAYIAGYFANGTTLEVSEIIAPELIVNIAVGNAAWPTKIFDFAWQVMGSGAHLLPIEVLSAATTKNFSAIPHAIEIAQLGAAAFARGEAIDCAYAVPQYLRNNVAKTTEERRNTGISKVLSQGVLV